MPKKDYPRIIEIKEDGRIIALDKFNKLNTDLNINTLTYQQQEEVFGGILIKDNYDNPNKYYNERDYYREKQLEEENNKNRKIKTWLLFGVIALLIIVAIFGVKACTNQNEEVTNNQDNQSTEQQSSQQNNRKNSDQKDKDIQKQIEETKDDIKNDNEESNTNTQIQNLQNEVNQLKQNAENTKERNKIINKYESSVDKLQQAKNAKDNGDTSKMKEELEDVNNKIDELKTKLNEWIK
ncbi:hypothetical protein [Staphylococcus aureus]|uniref:hypothetical protein n=1 Tax=Staphylococcus aureus TaxID=1280 RepID=UPI00098360C4|nr:hypothetical protein [Staphylococcus aureus]AQR26675.1 hypothetical protein AYM28_15375 [Staphylococcus aureus]AQR53194.1 hypothetical protein AYM37_15375 [Staphylococcus aureus]HCX0021358.1 hypothetical protein [Staphylococcus aureus]